MQKPTKGYDAEHRSLIEGRSVIRYEDVLWIYHGAWVDNATGKVTMLVSSRRNSKMRLIHNKDRRKVKLEFTVDDN